MDPKSNPDPFLEAQAGFQLFGEPLAPFSPSRKVAAQSMGMLYPFIGESGQAQYTSTGVYKGAVKDVCILLWLCSLHDRMDQTVDALRKGDWNPDMALMRPDEALGHAILWAQVKGVMVFDSPEWQEAYGVFSAIVSGMSASEFEVGLDKVKHQDGPRDEEGRGDIDPKV